MPSFSANAELLADLAEIDGRPRHQIAAVQGILKILIDLLPEGLAHELFVRHCHGKENTP